MSRQCKSRSRKKSQVKLEDILRRSGDLQGVEIQPLAGKRTHTFIESHEGRFCFPARATICNRFKNTGGSRDTVTHTLGTSTQSPAT